MTDIIVCRIHKGNISQRPQVQGDVAGANPPCARWEPIPLGEDWRRIAGQIATDLAVRRGIKNRLLLTVVWEKQADVIVYSAEEQKE